MFTFEHPNYATIKKEEIVERLHNKQQFNCLKKAANTMHQLMMFE